jgi:hypothetical protein
MTYFKPEQTECAAIDLLGVNIMWGYPAFRTDSNAKISAGRFSALLYPKGVLKIDNCSDIAVLVPNN